MSTSFPGTAADDMDKHERLIQQRLEILMSRALENRLRTLARVERCRYEFGGVGCCSLVVLWVCATHQHHTSLCLTISPLVVCCRRSLDSTLANDYCGLQRNRTNALVSIIYGVPEYIACM